MSGTDYIATLGKFAYNIIERKPGTVILINSAAFMLILYGIFFYLPEKQVEQIKNYDLWQKKHWYDEQAEIITTEEVLFKVVASEKANASVKMEIDMAYAELLVLKKRFLDKRNSVETELEKSGTRGDVKN